MTTATRREEYSSNIIRSLHPTTTITSSSRTESGSNLNENIDYLLDDLQSSVAGTSQYLASKNVQHLSPANTTTYIKERSVSPGRTNEKVYKTSSYQYSTSSAGGGGGGIGGRSTPLLESSQGVNQLDVLLQDLKKERELSTREKDYALSTSYTSGLETERLGSKSPSFGGTKAQKEELSIKHDVAYDSMRPCSPRWNTSISPIEKSHIYEKKVESTSTRDVKFGDTTSYRSTPTLSRSEKYIENRTVPYYEEKSQQVITSGLPDDLKNVPLSDDILPGPGTKVTTTVRTYTYEIPAEPTTQTTKKVLYKRELNEQSSSSGYPPERELPQSVTYKTESYRTTDRSIPPTIQTTTKHVTRKHDINDTSYIDKSVEFVTDDTPLVEKTVYRDVVDSKGLPPSGTSPGGPVTYYYKHHESTNTKNTMYGPPDSQQPLHEPYYPPAPSPQPAKTVTYRSYSSTKHTTTGEKEPLLQPAPFPTDNVENISPVEGPPKRLDDLMASLGNENVNSRDVETYVSRKEVDTSVATAERPPPTKNLSGPPVYYPPGREMFMKKEESSAAYRAGGGYANASAKYEYEAESRSKSKSKKGATMVPVCLPLCCAMPCSIM